VEFVRIPSCQSRQPSDRATPGYVVKQVLSAGTDQPRRSPARRPLRPAASYDAKR
jgi:hypothetical protein